MSSIKLSPSQSAYLIGVSERTIRRAIKNKEILVTVHHARYKIDFADLLAWSNQSTNRQIKRDEIGIGQFVTAWKIILKK